MKFKEHCEKNGANGHAEISTMFMEVLETTWDESRKRYKEEIIQILKDNTRPVDGLIEPVVLQEIEDKFLRGE